MVKYPIYTIACRFTYAGESEYPAWQAGPGRCHNSVSHVLAYKTEPTTLLLDAWTWWQCYLTHYRDKPDMGLNEIGDIEIKISEPRWDTWVEGWFSHWTWDTFADDRAVLTSFQEYVDRIRWSDPQWEGRLMGAEDRYRWKGSARENTEAPCHCEHCKKLGIVRIDH